MCVRFQFDVFMSTRKPENFSILEKYLDFGDSADMGF